MYSDGSSGNSVQLEHSDRAPLCLNFSIEEVIKAIGTMAGGKAPGPDGVPVDLYRADPELWGNILTHVFNAATQAGFPLSWEKAVIIPIF